MSKRFSIKLLCELFEVSRSGYYRWTSRIGQMNSYQVFQKDLDELVLEFHLEHPSLGYRSIRAKLLYSTGWKVSDLTVYHSMKRLKIKAVPRKPKYKYCIGDEHVNFPNVLDRNYESNEQMSKVVTDITMVMNRGKRNYLSIFIDLFNNSILSWEYGVRQDNCLILKPMLRLLQEGNTASKKIMIVHSDQGCQYASIAYRDTLKRNGIIQSMSRAGNPRDNAVAESVIGHLKDVLYYDYDFKNSKKPKDTLRVAIEYFNNDRPAFALDYKTPAQFSNERELSF